MPAKSAKKPAKSPKKKTAVAASKPKGRKLTAKPPVALAAKPKAKKATAHAHGPTASNGKNSFMWKLLEKKQEAQKKAQSQPQEVQSANPFDRQHGRPSAGFGRFAGPRRRAA